MVVFLFKSLIYHGSNDSFLVFNLKNIHVLAHYCSICHQNNTINHFRFKIRLGRWMKVWMI